MTTQPLPTKMPGLRPLSAKEEVQRQAAAACAMNKAPNCDTTVHVGIFFDGTNNNKERDQADSPPSHSNIVVLHDAYRDDPSEGYYKFYVPGVGTAFPQIGEPSESDAGKAYGTGGDARINWALIQLVNAIHRSAFDDRRIVPDPQAGRDASTEPLHNPSLFEFGANFAGKRVYFVEGREAFRDMGRMKPAIQPLLPRLRAALARAKGPQVKLVNLSVFGFSRGAAQARAFCDQLQRLLGREGHGAIARLRGTANPAYDLAGVPLRIQFLGLFDTVASVGLADASPTHRGFGGWANGTMDIALAVERCVHFVAAHEVRRAFPSSTGRIGPRAYPANCHEVVYPGAHSDVGGGYAPGSQGKAMEGRSSLLSQVPLLEMYQEAVKSGVPLRSVEELEVSETTRQVAIDLQIHPRTAQLFNAYARWAAPQAQSVEGMLRQHMRHYWRWRRMHTGPGFERLGSIGRAQGQERRDLAESEKDFCDDRDKVLAAYALVRSGRAGASPQLDEATQDFLADMRLPPEVPPEIDAFFDELVHDSHATFYMIGPTTRLDREQLVAKVREKAAAGKALSALEQRIAAQGAMPVLTDDDTQDLLALMEAHKSAALKVAGQKTRREMDGHIHYRRVFDKS